MFSVIFPGQGSQIVGMGKDIHAKFELVKKFFKEADEILGFSISNIILNGPKDNLNQTENTQPAILVGYSIFNLLKKEFNIDLHKASFFAGHSVGEYTALASSGSISFHETLKLLKIRGKAMQTSVPKGEGGMIAVLGKEILFIENLIKDKNYKCFIANDNSIGQVVVSGIIEDIHSLANDLKNEKVKNILLPVSGPFHCELMKEATEIMKIELNKLNIAKGKNILVSNVTARAVEDINEIKNLLTQQIESRVRWRECVNYMIEKGVNQFIEMGPGKVLSGLVKRINKNVKVSAINSEEDISLLKL